MQIGNPKQGFYKRRLVRGGVDVAVRIYIEDGDRDWDTGELLSDQIIRCEVDGVLQEDVFEHWSHCADNPISEAEYRYLLADRAWARRYAPQSPEANPRRPVDFGSMPVVRMGK